MSVSSAVSRGQARAESLMVDTCVVRRNTGRTVQDETTMKETAVYDDLFTSRCKVQARSRVGDAAVSERSDIVGAVQTDIGLSLHLPVSAPPVRAGDVAEITGVGPDSDPQLLGRKLRIVAPTTKSNMTARRLQVEDVV